METARNPTPAKALEDKLARLGDTPFTLRHLDVRMPDNAFVAPSELNDLRRRLAAALAADKCSPRIPRTNQQARALVTAHLEGGTEVRKPVEPLSVPAAASLVVMARTAEQARAAVTAGADAVVLDFLELTGTGTALRALRALTPAPAVKLGVAPPRIRKPGEEKIDRYLESLDPDFILVRSLGSLHDASQYTANATRMRIGDHSLNVTNSVTARLVLSRGLTHFTPSFDLDAGQLVLLLGEGLGLAAHAEVILHSPMPLFHMEHCVYAAMLSTGKDHRTCGRPCDRHALSLKDRAGLEHPVVADVGCRNTVFHQKAQTAADIAPKLLEAGVRRFRIELVRENARDVTMLVEAYRKLLVGSASPRDIWNALRVDAGYGVVRGSLRVLAAP